MFGGAQSALCGEDKTVELMFLGEGLALSPATVSLSWTLLQDCYCSPRARSLCPCVEVLPTGWGELCAHRMCLCVWVLPLRRAAFNCKVNLCCSCESLHWHR